eukprot:TRINITY_DN66159_c8_g1_i1.p1 TRINITY_DN66159_c8_g1~~TRINITY_DN66159_c8_g1_i1.p1  ORF type:complete len:635 (-),score=403.33 TRINITY_DN66159_c8_g1_i1:1975-3879(-)
MSQDNNNNNSNNTNNASKDGNGAAAAAALASSVDPLDLLKAELKEDEYEVIIRAMEKISIVASALGAERTRNELLPYLMEAGDEDNDEAQAVVARQLGSFVPLVGGPAHAHVLLPLLEFQAGLEETVVRQAAVTSLNTVIAQMPAKDVKERVMPVVRRLAGNDFFCARVSVCGVLATVYGLVDSALQDELREVFAGVCADSTPMVRKAAYEAVGALALNMHNDHIEAHLLPLVKRISQDDMDSVRFFTVRAVLQIAKKLPPKDHTTVLVPLLEGLHDDESWRVRQELTKNIVELCEVMGRDVAATKLMPLYGKLLKDVEPQVRIQAAKLVTKVSNQVGAASIEHVAPGIEELAQDPHEKVRITLSLEIVALCKPFGKDASVKILVPLIDSMLKDEQYEVRNNIVARMDELAELLGSDAAANLLLPSILDSATDAKWRVRMEVVKQCALVGKLVGLALFEKKMLPIVVSGLSDHVFAIRDASAKAVRQISDAFGTEFCADKLLPPAMDVFDKSTNYLHRMTALLVINEVAEVMAPDVIQKVMLPIALRACGDEVVNVRFGGAKSLNKLIPRLGADVIASDIKPALEKLQGDPDPDVQYYSATALRACESSSSSSASSGAAAASSSSSGGGAVASQ